MNDWMRLLNETPDDKFYEVVGGYNVEADQRFFDAYHMLIAAIEFKSTVEERLRKPVSRPSDLTALANYVIAVSTSTPLKVFSVVTLETFGPPQETFYLEWTKNEDGEFETLPAQSIFELSKTLSLTKMEG